MIIAGKVYTYYTDFFRELLLNGNPRRVLLDFSDYLTLADLMPQFRDFREGDHIVFHGTRVEPKDPPRRTDILDLSGGWPDPKTMCTAVDNGIDGKV